MPSGQENIREDLGMLKEGYRQMQQKLLEMEAECSKRDSEQAERISDLESWQLTCTKLAAGWGGMCAMAMFIGTMTAKYWDQLQNFFARVPKQ